MVRMSNCPALVAMSVVRRWRRTFSSSTTQRSLMFGLSRSNCEDRRCITTMSPLLTVAMVIVDCASAGEANSPAAIRAAAAKAWRWYGFVIRRFLPRSIVVRSVAPLVRGCHRFVKPERAAASCTPFRRGGGSGTNPPRRLVERRLDPGRVEQAEPAPHRLDEPRVRAELAEEGPNRQERRRVRAALDGLGPKELGHR